MSIIGIIFSCNTHKTVYICYEEGAEVILSVVAPWCSETHTHGAVWMTLNSPITHWSNFDLVEFRAHLTEFDIFFLAYVICYCLFLPAFLLASCLKYDLGVRYQSAYYTALSYNFPKSPCHDQCDVTVTWAPEGHISSPFHQNSYKLTKIPLLYSAKYFHKYFRK